MGCSDLPGKRILYVCEYGTASGGERSLLAWLPHVQAAGYDVIVVAPQDGLFIDALGNLEIPVIAWRLDSSAASSLLETRRKFLSDVIQKVQPDLVHANSLSMSRVAGTVAKDLGVTSIGHLRDIVRISRQAMQDLNCNTRLLAVSQATANWHIGHGLSPDATHVLYNGVDLTEFTPRPKSGYLHRELSLPAHARLLGSVGQIGMRKGLDVLLAAMPSIFEQFPDVHLLLAGERTSAKEEAIAFEQQLHHSASQPSLKGRIHFVGYRHDMPQLLVELTLLVHAARQEPLGRVLLEAAASGVPVIATDVGGTREIFEDPSARIIPADDSQKLTEAVTALLNDPVLMVKQAASAHETIEKRFDILQSSAELLRIYRALL